MRFIIFSIAFLALYDFAVFAKDAPGCQDWAVWSGFPFLWNPWLPTLLTALFLFYLGWAENKNFKKQTTKLEGLFQKGISSLQDAPVSAAEGADGASESQKTVLEKQQECIVALNEAFAASSFTSPWSEYKKQLGVFSFNREQISSKDTSENFFDLSFFASFLNLPWYKSLPSLFIGIGILFTFIGLCIALSFNLFKLNDLTAPDIQNILFGAAIAFVSSAVGIFCSLYWSMILKGTLHDLQEQQSEFCNLLNRRFPVITIIDLMSTKYENDSKALKDVGSQNQVLVGKIQNLFEDSLGTMMGRICDRFTQTAQEINASAKKLNDAGIEFEQAIQTSAKEFQDLLRLQHQLASKQIDAVQKQTVQFENLLVSGTKLFSRSLGESTQKMTDAMKKSADALGENIVSNENSIKEALEQIKDNLSEGMAKNFTVLETKYADQMKSACASLKNAEDSLLSLQGTIDSKLEEKLGELTAPLSARLFEGISGFQTTLDKLENQIKAKIAEDAKRLRGKIQDVEAKGLGGLENSLSEFSTAIEKEAYSSKAVLTSALDRLKNEFERLSHNLSDISTNTIASIAETQQTYNNLKAQNQGLNELQSKTDPLIKDIQSSLMSVKDKVGKLEKQTQIPVQNSLKQISENLKQEVSQVVRGKGGLTEILKSDIQEFEKALQAYAKNPSTIFNFTKEIRDLKSEVSRLKSLLEKAAQQAHKEGGGLLKWLRG